jgi:hypothetical protein
MKASILYNNFGEIIHEKDFDQTGHLIQVIGEDK